MNRIAMLKALERVAAVMRRAGLGRAVDAVRGRAVQRLGRFTVDVDGIVLTGDIAAHSSYVRELLDDGREGQVTALFEEAVPAGGLVLDVGAHLGYFTLIAARKGAEVIAFEPNPQTLPFLRENLRANGVEERVTVVEKALAGASGRRGFFISEGGDTSSLHDQGATVGRVEVETATADGFVAGRRVDVIKIDVEGAELEALAGMEATIAEAGADLRLFIECNPTALERAGAGSAALLTRLRELGLDPSLIDEEQGDVRPAGDDPAAGRPYVNLMCAPAAHAARRPGP